MFGSKKRQKAILDNQAVFENKLNQVLSYLEQLFESTPINIVPKVVVEAKPENKEPVRFNMKTPKALLKSVYANFEESNVDNKYNAIYEDAFIIDFARLSHLLRLIYSHHLGKEYNVLHQATGLKHAIAAMFSTGLAEELGLEEPSTSNYSSFLHGKAYTKPTSNYCAHRNISPERLRILLMIAKDYLKTQEELSNGGN